MSDAITVDAPEGVRRPQDPVDPWRPVVASFAEFLALPRDETAPYLTELGENRRRQWTVGEWRSSVRRVAEALLADGVKPGDTVATLCGNTAQALTVAQACWLIGACVLPLNPGEPASRHRAILAHADAKLLTYVDWFVDRVQELSDAVPRVLPADALVDRPSAGGEIPRLRGSLDQPALRIYTSGTTGAPKGVVLTLRNIMVHTDGLARALAWDESDRVMTVLPIHHVNGLLISCVVPWYLGATTVLCDGFHSSRFWEDIATEKATVCSVVPSLLEFLIAEGRGPSSGSSDERGRLRELLCGAGPLMPSTVTGFQELFGMPVRHLYGLSETTAVATVMPVLDDEERTRWYTEHEWPSIGVAIPHVVVSVLADDGREAAEGERGELVVRGATVMPGYADNPTANAEVFRHGWFHSGDEGFWLAQEDRRFFFITGRRKELIIRGGVNIAPMEVDTVLCRHPAVRAGLSFGFENRFYGEEIAAYVVLQPGAEAVAEDIAAFCRAELGFARSPKVVLFGEDVPFTSTGKAKRLDLKSRFADELLKYRDSQFRR